MKINVSVHKVKDDLYCATISGGWWVSYAKTEKAAIKSVMKNYERERDALSQFSS